MKNNCPNCGAPMIMNECQYCGTMLLNLMDIDFNESRQIWVKIRDGERVLCMRAFFQSVEVTAQPLLSDISIDGYPYLTMHNGTDLEIVCRIKGTTE